MTEASPNITENEECFFNHQRTITVVDNSVEIFFAMSKTYKFKFKYFLLGKASAKARTVSPSEKATTIQYGYRKDAAHARLFFQTLAHGNNKNEITQRNRRSR